MAQTAALYSTAAHCCSRRCLAPRPPRLSASLSELRTSDTARGRVTQRSTAVTVIKFCTIRGSLWFTPRTLFSRHSSVCVHRRAVGGPVHSSTSKRCVQSMPVVRRTVRAVTVTRGTSDLRTDSASR
eukprot:839541-Rhodomonas_salina.1